MGTRGLFGIRNGKELLNGRYNNYDSYYDSMGKESLDFYFDGEGEKILGLTKYKEEDKEFLQDGLFCEYAYIYNKENNTLEIYRGFFKTKQSGNTKTKILESLDDKENYYCHLIIIVDKKIHTKEEVLKAFSKYDKSDEDDRIDYPERDIIPLELNDDYVFLV